MSKQTKQLIFLVALVVVAGIVAVFALGGSDSNSGSKAPAKTAKAPPKAPEKAGAPKATGPAARGAAPKGGAAPAPAAENLDPLDVPRPVVDSELIVRKEEWPVKLKDPTADSPVTVEYDPFRVQNIEVVAPERRAYIERIRNEWKIKGFSETSVRLPKLDEDGNPVKDAQGNFVTVPTKTWEVWFEGKLRTFRENDRLTGTRFTIQKIVHNYEEAAVHLIGDNLEELKLPFTDTSRYGKVSGK